MSTFFLGLAASGSDKNERFDVTNAFAAVDGDHAAAARVPPPRR